MFKSILSTAALLLLVVASYLLIACGGSSGSGNGSGAVLEPVSAQDPLTVSARTTDATRLLAQASFGATPEAIAEVTQYQTIEDWIDYQISLPVTQHLPKVQALGNSSLRSTRHYVWWDTAINAPDQLRQRVAFALSEIFVVSDLDYTLGNAQYGMTDYYDMLASMAFGNYRELLERVSLHPVMGIYLSMVRNEKADVARNIRPDENYAREVMQLFSVGLYELDSGGNVVSPDNPIPTYSQSLVEEYARVFTGWNFADSPEWQSSDLTSYDKITPMVPQEQFHDSGSKTLLGGVVSPAGLSVADDMAIALDSIFNHPNVGPFFTKLLIQRLVTSNPSSGYVERVANVFNDNGSGTRGDLSAVIKAILLDDEARVVEQQTPEFGKLKEPLLKALQVLRAFRAEPGVQANGHYHMATRTSDQVDDIFAQAVLKSPSVFNFFSPDHPVSSSALGANGAPLLAPELQILTEAMVAATNNDFHSLIYGSNNRSGESSNTAMINIDDGIVMLRQGRQTLLEHLNVLLFSGLMSNGMQVILDEHIAEMAERAQAAEQTDAETDTETDAEMNEDGESELDETDLALAQLDIDVVQSIVLDTLFMMVASPEFLVQR